MSGAIIVETALENPDRVIGLIGVDNFKNFGGIASHSDSVALAGFYKEARVHFKETVGGFVNKLLFSPSTTPEVRQRVLKDMTGADSTIAIDILQQNEDYPLNTRLVAVKKTLCLINGDYIPNDTSAFRKKGVAFYLFDVGPTGHYPMIEKPDSFNIMLGRAIDQLGSHP
jgi:hypothetical protein